uniref:plasmid SOS inhibition protein A n=1 Tax=Serratia marcescens TaxID=615 RepID=UPI0039658DF9
MPWHPYRQAVWQAIAQVEARREAGRRLPVYPYATAFFRQLTGRPTLSAKDLRMIDVTYRPGDRRRATRKEDYMDALDTLIASRGEHCYSPFPVAWRHSRHAVSGSEPSPPSAVRASVDDETHPAGAHR